MVNQVMPVGKVRKMTENDLETVLQWRNHIDVRRFMYTQHEISPDEHCRWFNTVIHDALRELLIFEADGMPQGYIQLSLHKTRVIADWGFYLAPQAPKGMGSKLGKAALDYAFCERGLHKVCGEALAFNEKSIRFHVSLGFKQEGLLRDQHYDGNHYHDVYCFGLLSKEWC